MHERIEGTNIEKETDMTKKRRFGAVRTLPSGMVQASYIGPDHKRHRAPTTFRNRPQANAFLRKIDAEIRLGQWSTWPRVATVDSDNFGEYCERHIRVQTTKKGRLLERSTQAHYRQLLATHLSPFVSLRLESITPTVVADWWAAALPSGHITTLSKAYKLLSATLKRAVKEGHLASNPCQVTGAQSAQTGKKVCTPLTCCTSN